jgi:hypothetical protein
MAALQRAVRHTPAATHRAGSVVSRGGGSLGFSTLIAPPPGPLYGPPSAGLAWADRQPGTRPPAGQGKPSKDGPQQPSRLQAGADKTSRLHSTEPTPFPPLQHCKKAPRLLSIYIFCICCSAYLYLRPRLFYFSVRIDGPRGGVNWAFFNF